MANLAERIQRLSLSGLEVGDMTGWSDAMVEDYLSIGEALDLIASFVDGIVTFSAIPTENAGDGTVWGDMNATDWTGDEHAQGSALFIGENETCIVAHKDILYQYIGVQPVTIGVGGTYTSVEEDYVPLSSSDHQALNNRDSADCHPISAITGLQDKVNEYDTHVGDDRIHGRYYEQTTDPKDGGLVVVGSWWYRAGNFIRINTISGWIDVLLKSVYDAHVAGTAGRHNATQIDFDGNQITEPSITNLNELALFADNERSMREVAPTGVLSGDFVIVNGADPTVAIDVPAGTAEVIDGYTDREKPERLYISWTSTTIDLSTYFIMPVGVVTILIQPNLGDPLNSTVSVVQGVLPSSEFRTNVLLAYVFYHDGAIDTVLNSPLLSNEVGNNLNDYVNYLVPSERARGLQVRAVTALPSIWMESGKIFHLGSNVSALDPTNPNILLFPQLGDDITPVPFEIHYADGSTYLSAQTVIPEVYQPDPLVNAVTALTGGKATIHYTYRTVGGEIILQLGQHEYASGKEARDSVAVDWSTFQQFTGYQSVLFTAQIYWANNTTDFDDPTKSGIVNRGDVGGSGSAVVGATTFLGLTDIFEASYTGNQRRMVSVNDLQTGMEFRDQPVTWRGVWAIGAYEVNDMVINNAFTMIANKDTSEVPAPVPIGTEDWFMPEDPAWTHLVFGGVNYQGVRITNPPTSVMAYAVRVWVENPAVDNVYRIYKFDYNTGITYSLGTFTGELFNTKGWHEFGIITTFIGVNDDIGFWVSTTDESNITTNSYNYNFIGNVNAEGDPLSGNISTKFNARTIRISETDSGAVDRTAVLAGIKEGDLITVRNVADPTKYLKYRCDEVGVDQGAYWTFTVNLDEIEGEMPIGACTLELGVVTTASSDYETLTDTFLDYPSVQGGLRLGGSAPTFNNDAHGIDVRFQQYAEAEDWDLVAYSGVSGGGGGGTVWGEITGVVTDQTDMINEMNKRAIAMSLALGG